MKKQQIIFASLFSVVIILQLVSFMLCVAAEFKISKKKDLKFEGKLCILPKSMAFGLCSTALSFLIAAQIMGSLLICSDKSTSKNNNPTILPFIFLLISWMSFGICGLLLSVVISMNASQELGEGWLNGECYLVKDGVCFGVAALVIITMILSLYSAILTMRRSTQVDQQNIRVHAQLE